MVDKAHSHRTNNLAALCRSAVSGGFYCLAIYSPSTITEWTDYDDSALCIKCGIDSVLAESSGDPITAFHEDARALVRNHPSVRRQSELTHAGSDVSEAVLP